MKRLQQAWAAWLALPEVARLGLIIAVVVVAALLWPRAARAEAMKYTRGADIVRIYDAPCVNLAVLGHLQPQYHDKVQRASAAIEPDRRGWRTVARRWRAAGARDACRTRAPRGQYRCRARAAQAPAIVPRVATCP